MNNQSNFEMSDNENGLLTQESNTNSPHANVYFGIGIFCLAIGIAVFLGILYHGIKNL